jgi:hypothetical protein
MNTNKESAKSHSNNSLIASFAAFVDFYRPRYVLLENVATVIRSEGEDRRRSFAVKQLIGSFVHFSLFAAPGMPAGNWLSNPVQFGVCCTDGLCADALPHLSLGCW